MKNFLQTSNSTVIHVENVSNLSGNPNNDNTSYMDKITCNNCNKQGHYWYICPDVVCKYCHVNGHIAKNCPNRTGKALFRSYLHHSKKISNTLAKEMKDGKDISEKLHSVSIDDSLELLNSAKANINNIIDNLTEKVTTLSNSCDTLNTTNSTNSSITKILDDMQPKKIYKWVKVFSLSAIVLVFVIATTMVFNSHKLSKNTVEQGVELLQERTTDQYKFKMFLISMAALLVSVCLPKFLLYACYLFGFKVRSNSRNIIIQTCFALGIFAVILSVNNITKLEVTNEYTRNITEVTSYVDQHYNNSQVINQLQQTSGDLDRKINSIFKILADAKIQELQTRKQYLQSKNTIGSRAMDFFVGTAQITSGNPFAILNGIRTIKDTITNNNNEEINDLETQINNLQNRKEEYEEETINMESLENDSNQFQAKDQAGSINDNSLNNTRTSYFDTISTAGASIAGGLAGIWASTKGLTNLYDKITTKTNQAIATAQDTVAKVFNKPKDYEKFSTSYKMQPGVKTGNIQDFNIERANYFHMNNYKDHHITNDVENGDSIRYLYKKYNYEDEIPSIRKAKNWYYGSYKRHPERYKLAGEDNGNFKW